MNNNKTNGDHALSFFFRLLIISIGCLIMSVFVFTVSNHAWVRALIQLCNIILLLGITYSYFHKIGDSDAVLVNSGYAAERKFRGLIIGLLASIPSFITVVLLIMERLDIISINMYNYYKIANAPYFPLLNTLFNVQQSIFETSILDFIIAISVVLIVPLMAFFAYNLGLHRFSFSEKIFYKKIKD